MWVTKMKSLLVQLPVVALTVSLFFSSTCAFAQPEKGEILPSFRANDVFERIVDLTEIPNAELVILFFFSPESSRDLALRFRSLQKSFGSDSLYVAAIGLDNDRAALKEFAQRYRLQYFVLPDESGIDAAENFGPFTQRPLTFVAARDRTLLTTLRGGGETAQKLATSIATKYLQQGNFEKAEKGAALATVQGEAQGEAQQVAAYAKLGKGEGEAANAIFEQLNLASGKARVALESGDIAGAIEIARSASDDDAYAAAVLGQALMASGKQEEALAAFDAAAGKADAMADFQAAEALNGKGRLLHATGDTAAAKAQYELAHRSNYFAIETLTNLAAAYQDEGETGSADLKESLEQAKEVIEKAKRIAANIDKEDALADMIGRDIADALQDLADTQRMAARAERIKELGDIRRKQKEEGTAEPADAWTSRRRVIAITPPFERSTVFFARAGTELALRRAVERALQEHEAIEVVDRDELDGVIQELQLSANDLASEATQLELGRLFNAGYLGFLEFMESLGGGSIDLNVKVVNPETTQVPVRAPVEKIDRMDLDDAVKMAVDSIVEGILAEPLRGRVVQDPDGETVLIGLGSDYGVKPGMKFRIIVEGEPIVVRGKERPGPSKTIGLLEVTENLEGEGDLAYAKILKLNDGEAIVAETKIEEFRQ